MKGIILAGGAGTRLYPVTYVTSKQLLPVYNKPMIYYPLSVLMLAGIRDILIISSPMDIPRFEQLFGDGAQLGLNISYAIQDEPRGLAHAFIVGREFVGAESVCLVLGDNIFFGQGFQPALLQASHLTTGALIFGYWVKDPKRYGVVDFDQDMNVVGIEEKPEKPKSNYAIPGLYFYDNKVISIAEQLEPSSRGELEITDVNRAYLQQGKLKVKLLGRGFAWFDTGTTESYLEACNYVETIEKRQGLKVACIEEVAYRMGYITADQIKVLAEHQLKSGYGQYLLDMLSFEVRGVLKSDPY